VRGNEVVHRHYVDFFAEKAFVADRSKHEATNAAKAVNADFCHNVPLAEVENTGAESAAFATIRHVWDQISGVCCLHSDLVVSAFFLRELTPRPCILLWEGADRISM